MPIPLATKSIAQSIGLLDGWLFDYDHPLAADMVAALLPMPDGRLYDWCRDRDSAIGAIQGGGPLGPALATWSIPHAKILDLQFTTADFTIAALVHIPTVISSTDSASPMTNVYYNSNADNGGYGLFVSGTTGSGVGTGYSFASWNDDQPALEFVSAGPVTVGDHFMAGQTTGGGTSRACYVDGTYVSAILHSFLPKASPNPLASNQSGTAKPFLYVGYMWSRPLSLDDLHWINEEPFAVFRKPVYRTLVEIGYFSPVVNRPFPAALLPAM